MADGIDRSFNSLSLGLDRQPGDDNNSSGNTAAQQSASARFERFFQSGSPSPTQGYSSSGLPSTSGSGLPAGGAFGSFGHALAPGSIGIGGGQSLGHGTNSPFGTGQYGSQSQLRKTGSRAAIPQNWAPGAESGSGFVGDHGQTGSYAPSPATSRFLTNPPGPDDDIIPTAIVVKNIPFSVAQEQLLQIIEDLAIPMPYAFNYHYDQNQFRGLAFANFRSPEEADAVVAALNGFDVQGRKLRVEYKKVLQAGEKERIEKEKAIKRMQSMQLEKERRRTGTEDYGSSSAVPSLPPPASSQQQVYQQQTASNLAYPSASLGQHYGAFDNNAFGQNAGSPSFHLPQEQSSGPVPLTADSLRAVQAGGPADDASDSLSPRDRIEPARSEKSGVTTKKDELDLNDAPTLEIYSRVLLFKDDRMRDELAFSRSLSPLERRTVHLVAQKLGLFHYSRGENDERFVVVTKNEAPTGQRQLRSQASTIGRSSRRNLGASEAFASPGYSNGMLSPGSATTGRQGLRMKKSAPDMKNTYSDGNRPSVSDAFGFGTGAQGNSLLNPVGHQSMGRRSNTNLREGFSATVGRRSAGGIGGAAGLQSLFASPFDVPPVPALSGQYSGTNSGGGSPGPDGASSLAPMRQPRGPPTPGGPNDSRNFRATRITVGAGAGSPIGIRREDLMSDSYANAPHMLPGDQDSGIDAQSHQPLEI